MAGAFIEARDLRKTYHVGKIEVEALRGISFSVQKGEFVSVVGPSGSGKSTLFYLLGGLTRADGGSVVLDGDDLAKLQYPDSLEGMRHLPSGEPAPKAARPPRPALSGGRAPVPVYRPRPRAMMLR